jgi:anti-sigma regulatory factor (Ser/Thr protein kinase)
VSASAGDLTHSHVVAVYERDHELAATVADFVLDGLEQGGTGIVVATLPHRRAIARALTSRGVGLDELVDSGRYRSLDARHTLATLLRDGHLDPDAFDRVLGDLIGPASAAGPPVHVFGEMVALLWDDGKVAGALDLESLWNRLTAQHRFALLCAYGHASLERSDLRSTHAMCDRHSAVLPLFDTPGPGRVEPDAAARLFLVAPTAPQEARAFVRTVLDQWGVHSPDGDAEIVASELTTNAVRHARSPFVVALTRERGAVRIAVRDTSPELPAHIVRDDSESGGRGVRLVDALATAWGVVDEVDGKSVWAEIPTT